MLRCLRSTALLLAITVVGLGVSPGAHAAGGFTAGNIVVYRVGDGTTTLSSTSAPVFLDEFKPNGTLVQSVALPTVATGANHRLVASGSATSEGLLTLSTNGQYLSATGYDAPVGTATIAGTASATTPRVVARVDSAGAIDTTTALTDFATGNNPRSAVSVDGTTFWVSGAAGGIRTAPLGASTSTQVSSTGSIVNFRQAQIFNGQLYASDNSGTALRLSTVGTGTPTTSGQTVTNIPGFETAAGSPYSFAFLDLDQSVPGVDTLYVADDSPGQIQKYSLLGGTWTAEGTIAATGVRGLTASASGTTVTLYGSTAGALYTATDSSGPGATINGTLTTIATAPTNEAFRGIAFAPTGPGTPVPEVPFQILLPLSVLLLLGLAIGFETRRRRLAGPPTH